MDQDATLYGGWPQPKRHCVRWEPSSLPPKGGGAPQFSANVYCDQTAGWVKMPLDINVGLSQGHIVLAGNPAPFPQRGTAPNFRLIYVVAKWLNGRTCHLVGRYRPQSKRHCVRWVPSSPPRKGAEPPLLWPNGWMDEDATWYGSRP